MVALNQLFPNNQVFQVVHQSFNQEQGQLALAHTNALLAFSTQLSQPIIHFWTLPQNVILGMMDTKLPDYQSACASLTAAGYPYTVRNAGGLGVVADAGVLNIGLYLPHLADQLSIDDAYELIADWLVQTYPHTPEIAHFEVDHSYCPGNYDLSINGQKFAGIAQRRSKNGIAILLYASINGQQKQRGQLMQTFYQQGNADQQQRWQFPTVEPDSMANLADLLDQPLTVALVQQQLLARFNAHYFKTTTDLVSSLDQSDYQQLLQKQFQQLSRYQ